MIWGRGEPAACPWEPYLSSLPAESPLAWTSHPRAVELLQGTPVGRITARIGCAWGVCQAPSISDASARAPSGVSAGDGQRCDCFPSLFFCPSARKDLFAHFPHMRNEFRRKSTPEAICIPKSCHRFASGSSELGR